MSASNLTFARFNRVDTDGKSLGQTLVNARYVSSVTSFVSPCSTKQMVELTLNGGGAVLVEASFDEVSRAIAGALQ